MCVASDGIKLTFFLGAGGLLCLRFRMRTTLIRHGCFSCCWVVLIISQGHFSFLLPCQQGTGRWEGYEELEKDRTRTDDPNWLEGCLIHYMPACGTVNWGELARGAYHSSRTGWHQSEGGEQLHCASFVFTYLFVCLFFIIIIVIPSFSVLSNCLYVNPPVL